MSWLNPGRWLLYAAFAAALLLGIWRLDVSRQAIGYDRATAEQAVRDKAADAQARETETKWQTKFDEVSNDAQTQIDSLQIDLADAGRTADRLLSAAKVAASRARANPGATAASAGQSCPDTADLLSTLLDRHSAELVEVGGHADRLKIAGLACERAYDSIANQER